VLEASGALDAFALHALAHCPATKKLLVHLRWGHPAAEARTAKAAIAGAGAEEAAAAAAAAAAETSTAAAAMAALASLAVPDAGALLARHPNGEVVTGVCLTVAGAGSSSGGTG
jgi:hypothetical protein